MTGKRRRRRQIRRIRISKEQAYDLGNIIANRQSCALRASTRAALSTLRNVSDFLSLGVLKVIDEFHHCY